jgi:hypothetical protein
VEEVDRERCGRLDAQELPPARVAAAGRRWRYPGLLQDPADRRGGDPVTELSQLTLDALIAIRVQLVGYQLHTLVAVLAPFSLTWIGQNWTDMRPLSLREALER